MKLFRQVKGKKTEKRRENRDGSQKKKGLESREIFEKEDSTYGQ